MNRKLFETRRWLTFMGMVMSVLPLVVGAMVTLSGCGTGIGNPEDDSNLIGEYQNPTAEAYLAPEQAYENSLALIDCGRYDDKSSRQDVESGRQCLQVAFQACGSARYLLSEKPSQGYWFVSFVEVNGCTLIIHTVSNDPSRFVGDRTASCDQWSEGEIPELACGIGG